LHIFTVCTVITLVDRLNDTRRDLMITSRIFHSFCSLKVRSYLFGFQVSMNLDFIDNKVFPFHASCELKSINHETHWYSNIYVYILINKTLNQRDDSNNSYIL
jgi:hypothetical protein